MGLLSQMTPEQRAKALSWRGSENIGGDEFRLKPSTFQLSEGQIMALREIAKWGDKMPKKKSHKRGYIKPPELPIVRENVTVLLREGLVRSRGPHSLVVRISAKGLAVLAAIRAAPEPL